MKIPPPIRVDFIVRFQRSCSFALIFLVLISFTLIFWGVSFLEYGIMNLWEVKFSYKA